MEIRELVLRRSISVWINSFNQSTYLRNIVGKFVANQFRNIYILDNNSTSPALIEYYKELSETTASAMVLYYNANLGPWYFHASGLYKMLGDSPHIYTDPDIDFDVLPDNFVSRLIDLSEELKLPKIGCALAVPSREEMKSKFDYETQMEHGCWQKKITENIYDAPVDTTLHLFNPKYYSDAYFTGVRVAENGFVVRHLPWYANDPMSDDEYEYYKRSDTGYSHC